MYEKIAFEPLNSAPGKNVFIVLFDDTKELPKTYQELDDHSGGVISQAITRPDFSTAKGKTLALYPTGKHADSRLWILGLGSKEKFTLDALRLAAAKGLGIALGAKLEDIDLILGSTLDGLSAATPQAAARAIADGFTLGNFEFKEFKGLDAKSDKAEEKGAKPKAKMPKELTVRIEETFVAEANRGVTIAESANFARKIAATPPNVANPAFLVSTAKKLATQTSLTCTIIDEKKAKKLGMGGLLAVGAAGSTPPALICLEHKPKGAKGAAILIVGKAVTFDTGGYSIKPADGMDKMKYDKCGGMAVFGAMRAISLLRLPVHVIGLLPAAENMISEKAYRPGDIVTFCNGVTSEITNTDAEGRLILADALAWGTKTFKPQAVIDLATLTGGVVVALGSLAAGCFCADPTLRGKLFDAADFTGERLWHLPLWEEHREMIKATHGDIVNSAGREAHPIQGAAFLSFFIEPDGRKGLPTTPWAHLDIAGMSDVKKETGVYSAGPTGFGVRLLTRMVEEWATKA